MSSTFRPERVGDQLRSELCDLLAREVHDPGIGFVTVTRVRVTADLQLARVYYTSLGGDSARRETERGLRRAAPFLRREIGRRLRLRRAPELQFIFDRAVEGQERIERLIEEVHAADAAPSTGSGQADSEHSPTDDTDGHER